MEREEIIREVIENILVLHEECDVVDPWYQGYDTAMVFVLDMFDMSDEELEEEFI